MKQPNLYQRLKAALFPTVVDPLPRTGTVGFNNGVTIYPYSNDLTYINKGYNKNAWVYSIVSKCAKKFSQIPWYHYKIKTSERKTWFEEYIPLTKERLSDPKAMIEARKMRTKSVDQVAVDSPVSKLLKKANRNQSGASFMEQLYGFKLLTGEGNIWLPKGDGDRPTEMIIIPKSNLGVVKGENIWDISQYRLLFSARSVPVPKENIIMWKFANYCQPDELLNHLRGQSPLDAGLLLLQSSNEGAERLIAMNKNQGAAGLVFDKSVRDYPTAAQATTMRQQFNLIVNDSDLAGQIAYLTGDLNYFQFGLDAGQLKLLEQSDVQFKGLCNIYDVPWQLFGNADSYENRKQYKRDFVYDNIAVAAYGLRDELNARLIKEFSLDRERDVIDCDVMALPELAEDLKTQAETLAKLWQLTPNQVLEYIGYDRSTDPLMDKIYVPAGLIPLEQLNADMGGGLHREIELLNE